jgi:hypothetical protein
VASQATAVPPQTDKVFFASFFFRKKKTLSYTNPHGG